MEGDYAFVGKYVHVEDDDYDVFASAFPQLKQSKSDNEDETKTTTKVEIEPISSSSIVDCYYPLQQSCHYEMQPVQPTYYNQQMVSFYVFINNI